MVQLFRRSIPVLLNLFLTTGLQVSGYTNLYVAISLWALMVPLALFALWPWLKRWRPWTVVPANGTPSEANQEFFTPQKEVGGVRGSRYYKDQPIYFPDIVRELATQLHKGKGPLLQELTFEGCQIHGPAMLKPVPGSTNPPWFQRCEWEEDLGAFYVEDPQRTATGSIGHEIGVIGLQDCVFRDCYFRGVGVVLTQVGYDIAKEQYKLPGATTISL